MGAVMRALSVLAVAALLVGCAADRSYGPAATLQLRDAQTVHNVEASRIWIVQTGRDGHQRVVLCDIAFMAGSPTLDARRLCIVWPP